MQHIIKLQPGRIVYVSCNPPRWRGIVRRYYAQDIKYNGWRCLTCSPTRDTWNRWYCLSIHNESTTCRLRQVTSLKERTMVAVRSAHLNKAGEFDPKKWIASLGISSQQSCERLAETWDYCREKTQGHPQARSPAMARRGDGGNSLHVEHGYRYAARGDAFPAGGRQRRQRRDHAGEA